MRLQYFTHICLGIGLKVLVLLSVYNAFASKTSQNDKRRMRLQYSHQMAKEVSDKYTDTHTHVIKKKAGRRPAFKNTRGA